MLNAISFIFLLNISACLGNVISMPTVPMPNALVTWDETAMSEKVRPTGITARWTSTNDYKSVSQTFLWGGVRSHKAGLKVLTLSEVPACDSQVCWSDLHLSQSIHDSGITARWLNETNYRCVVQSFSWSGDGYMTGAGFRIAPNQNGGAGLNYTRNQSYALDVQRLSGSQVIETIHTEIFTLPTEYVIPGKVIRFEFDTPLYLTNGTYGLNLRPIEIKGGNVLVVAKSVDGTDPLVGGAGGQGSSPGVIDGSYSQASFDCCFFATDLSYAGALASVGVRLAPNQNGGSGLNFVQSQRYAVDIYEVDNAGSASPQIEQLVYSSEFLIHPEDVYPNAVIQFDLTTPQILEEGGSYGFNLRPVDILAGNSLVIAMSDTNCWNGTYAYGYGSQTGRTYPLSGIFPVSSPNFNLLFYLSNRESLIKKVVFGPTNTYFTYTHENGFWPDSDHAVVMRGVHPDYTKALLWNMASNSYTEVHDFNAPLKMYYSVSQSGKLLATVRNKLRLVDLNGIEPEQTVYDAGAAPPDGPWSLTDTPDISHDGSFAFFNLVSSVSNDYSVCLLNLASNQISLTLSFDDVMNHVHFSPYDENWLMFGHSGGHPSEYRDRLWGYHSTYAPLGTQLWDQQGSGGTSFNIGHERAAFHTNATVFVAYDGSTAGGGLGQVMFDGTFTMLSSSDHYWHCNIDHTGAWAVVDSIVNPGGAVCDILLVNTRTGAFRFLYRTSRGTEHPYHPHPHISPDGRWVVFTDFDTGRVIAVEIDQSALNSFLSL